LQCVAVRCRVLHWVAVCCNGLQYFAVCYSVLQCVFKSSRTSKGVRQENSNLRRYSSYCHLFEHAGKREINIPVCSTQGRLFLMCTVSLSVSRFGSLLDNTHPFATFCVGLIRFEFWLFWFSLCLVFPGCQREFSSESGQNIMETVVVFAWIFWMHTWKLLLLGTLFELKINRHCLHMQCDPLGTIDATRGIEETSPT